LNDETDYIPGFVMAGLVRRFRVDARHKAGHDAHRFDEIPDAVVERT